MVQTIRLVKFLTGNRSRPRVALAAAASRRVDERFPRPRRPRPPPGSAARRRAGRSAAESATSASFTDNAASIAVSRKLGYRPDGLVRENRQGEPALTQRFRLDRADWQPTRREDIHLAGLADCTALFGLPG
ncbi:GNAT family protein [Kitasatospora sp. CB01950]|uniref:GNAT family protein n=1 Tax=Kitasatospora sp. CB01950 TaxID=1703930 RepID=UPI00093B7297|nr:GNAT family protein [Kitasatospora sp. CB01950]